MTIEIKTEFKLIGVTLRKADKSNERAKVHKYWCQKTDICPLFKRGMCIRLKILGSCIYGEEALFQSNSTKKGKAYGIFIKETEAKLKSGEYFKPPKAYYKYCIQLIGDYYYLPYAQMNHKDGKLKIPFLEHSSFMISGSNFIKKEDFTTEVICEIVKLRPYAMMGGEIKSYQEEEIPKFLFHLKYLFPKLFNKAVNLMPEIEDRVLDLSIVENISANLSDIPKNCVEGYTIGKGISPAGWDGENLTIKGDQDKFSMFFSGIKAEGEIIMSFKPNKSETKVNIIASNLRMIVCQKNPELIK